MSKYDFWFSFFKPFGYVINLIWRYRVSEKWHEIKTAAYSTWLKKEFGSAGQIKISPTITIKNPKEIHLGDNVKIGANGVLTAWMSPSGSIGKIEIGDNCNIGENVHITAINKIKIGKDVLTGRWVTITDNSHGNTDSKSLTQPPLSRELVSKGDIIIGDSVWIGDKVVILPNVNIGQGAVIAANSVVTKDVPPFTVVAGVPAKQIQKS